MKSKKIILIRSSEATIDVRIEKIARSLNKFGHKIEIVCWDRSASLPKIENVGYAVINRIGIKSEFGMGIRLLPKLTKFWLRTFIWLLKNNFDAIHSCDFDTIVPSLPAAKLRNKKIIYDIFDFYSEGGNVPSKLRIVISKIDKFLMRFVNKIIVVDDARISFLPKNVMEKVEVIYNSPLDLLEESRIIANNCNKIPKKSKAFRLVYSGRIIDGRYIKEMIEAITTINTAEMVIAGFGNLKDISNLENFVSLKKNISFIGRLTHNESLGLEYTADVIFSLNDPDIPNNKMASSNKLFEAMMLEKPVVINSGTSMEKKVNKYGCGLVIPAPTVEKIKDAVQHLMSDENTCHVLGKNGRRAFKNEFSWELMEKKLRSIYSF